MKNKTLGTTLLVIGTSLGGGMLALPSVTASNGFIKASLFLIFAWLVMTLGALLMVEVNLALPRDNNIISMAQKTLGRSGQIVAWIIYLALFYSLLSAYISGGSGVVQALAKPLHLDCPAWLGALIFTALLGGVVWHGIHSMDRLNRLLMSIKFVAYVGLIALIFPHVHLPNLNGGKAIHLFGAMTVMITSFGFAGSVPSFCRYLDYDPKKIRIAVISGSTITLICYLLWDAAVQGSIHAAVLTHNVQSGNAVAGLMTTLSAIANSHSIYLFTHLFISICMFTAFLGVSIGLSDFLVDGMRIKKRRHKPLVYGTTFLPPLMITLFYPHAFIVALSYAGIFCLILLMLMPAMMAWQGRYKKNLHSHYHVWGGQPLVLIEIILGVLLVATAIVVRVHSVN
ncbi:MAG: amino acid permease [Gammaproteobacteria bacterium]|nr:amino acid permease [Gammaproteobacteria bacterium]